MSYCVNCGVELDDSAERCPLCGTPAWKPDPAAPSYFPTKPAEVPPASRKAAAALLTAMLASVSLCCGLLNLILPTEHPWALYVAGAAVMLWVWFALPMLARGIPIFFRLTADVAAIGVYVWIISLALHGGKWFRGLVLPMLAWACVVVFLLSFLLRDGRRSRLSSLALCIGAAGSSLLLTERIIRRALDLAGFRGALRLCGDHEIALRGAMDGAGCVLIAGTGSICFGVNNDGVSARCGGYGHILDDAGSGYAIGRDALREAVRSADGRSEPSALSRAVLGRFPQGIGELIEYVYSKAGKADIASFAETVIECAAAGDETSLEILHREARELSELVQALSRRLGMARPRTALLGGLIASDNVYSGIVRRELEGTAEIVPPAHDALWGAAQMAYEQTGA